MKLKIAFDTDQQDLLATELARLLLDLQHLSIVAVYLPRPAYSPKDIIFDPFLLKYEKMFLADPYILGETAPAISRIHKDSPLEIELLFKKLNSKAVQSVSGAFRFLFERVLFGDLEREKRRIENEAAYQEVLRKKLELIADAYKLSKKMPPDQQDQFMDSLRWAIEPFERRHPPIERYEIDDDDDGSYRH